MSGQLKGALTKHQVDKNKLESAILDAQGDVLLLEMVVDDLNSIDSWQMLGREPMDGYKLWLLTNDQVRVLQHISNRVLFSVQDVATEFWGHEVAKSA